MTLQSLHLRKFNYEIVKVNKYVQLSSKAIRQGAPSGQALSNQELLFYLFNTYKRIKAPSAWTAKINFLESQAGCDTTYTPTVLMDEVDKYYNDLKNNDEWRPSDQSAEETIIAMLANLKKPPKQPTSDKNRMVTSPRRKIRLSLKYRQSHLQIKLERKVIPRFTRTRPTTIALECTRLDTGLPTHLSPVNPRKRVPIERRKIPSKTQKGASML